jgi:hypothetical protein
MFFKKSRDVPKMALYYAEEALIGLNASKPAFLLSSPLNRAVVRGIPTSAHPPEKNAEFEITFSEVEKSLLFFVLFLFLFLFYASMDQPFDITTLSKNSESCLNTGLVFASLDSANTSTCLTTSINLYQSRSISIDPDQLQSTISATTKEKAKRNIASNHDNCSFHIRLCVKNDLYCGLWSASRTSTITTWRPHSHHLLVIAD